MLRGPMQTFRGETRPVTERKWLAVVGIGEDGVAGLGAAARRHIAEAEVVFGGRRHLALAAPLIRGEARAWPSPFDPAMAAVVALRGRAVCVLASGDPFLHGVGRDAGAAGGAGGDGGGAGGLGLQPRGGAARLAAGRGRDGVAARPGGGAGPAAAASGDAGPGADLGRWRGRRRSRGCWWRTGSAGRG